MSGAQLITPNFTISWPSRVINAKNYYKKNVKM
jgi:hypothetical protein